MNVLKFKRVGNHDLPLPSRATPGSAGFDMRAAEDVVWCSVTGTVSETENSRVTWNDPACHWADVRLGFAVEIPPGFELQCRPRSGLANTFSMTLRNSPGTIDSDYRGELRAMLICHTVIPPTLKKGDRICQLVPNNVPTFEAVEVDELSETERGQGGFGSTGVA